MSLTSQPQQTDLRHLNRTLIQNTRSSREIIITKRSVINKRKGLLTAAAASDAAVKTRSIYSFGGETLYYQHDAEAVACHSGK